MGVEIGKCGRVRSQKAGSGVLGCWSSPCANLYTLQRAALFLQQPLRLNSRHHRLIQVTLQA